MSESKAVTVDKRVCVLLQNAVEQITNLQLPSCTYFFMKLSKRTECEYVVFAGTLYLTKRIYQPDYETDIWSILIGAFLLSYKWFVDDHYTNEHVSQTFENFTLTLVNAWENYVFAKCDYNVYMDYINLNSFTKQSNLPCV